MCYFFQVNFACIRMHSIRVFSLILYLNTSFLSFASAVAMETCSSPAACNGGTARCSKHFFKDIFVLRQDHGVTFAATVTTEIQQEGLDRFGHASRVTVTRMSILTLLGTATELRESAWSAYTTLEDVNVTSVCQVWYHVFYLCV